MKLSHAIPQLERLHDRLDRANTDRKRRSARRAFIGALRSIRHALDEQYPSPKRVKPPVEPKPKREPFKTGRAFDIDTARLFLRVASDATKFSAPRLVVHDGARKGMQDVHAQVIYYAQAWTPTQKWQQLLNWLSAYPGVENPADLLRRFWSETIPVSDLGLAAEHHAFVEDAEKRRERALRAAKTRQKGDVVR
jgi:hypothetical protein